MLLDFNEVVLCVSIAALVTYVLGVVVGYKLATVFAATKETKQ